MKILIVTADFVPGLGGIASFNQGIAESMALAGHQMFVLAPNLPNASDKGLPYRVIRYKRTMRFANLWPSLITLYLSLTIKYDIVLYGHAASTLSAGGIIARKLNLNRLIVLTHGNDLDYVISNKIDKYFLDKMLRTSDLILANSSFTKDKVLKKYHDMSKKVKILNPGVWPNKIYKTIGITRVVKNSKIVILTVGRLVPKKGLDDLIVAFATVIKKHPKITLKIVGQGPERVNLESLARQLGVNNSIIFVGEKPVNEIYDEMMQCDLFVLPSKIVNGDIETFGIVYLEAGACGKAVIGTRQGGVPDAIAGGVSGILVAAGNITQLINAMLKLIENEGMRSKMGIDGKKRVEEMFAWPKIAKMLEEHLKSIK
ncbi:MAG: glycosyltransferase family 4 protein [Candidatus Edwardsbacteria bacterium]|nr:glycosyltransferase family 4 protein [Candidatus Edwardsbacteria bacterium]